MPRDDGGVAIPHRSNQPHVSDLPQLVERAARLAADHRRVLLGITGPPGVGKSTLAKEIVRQVGDRARLVEMDGFHLPQSRLSELGRLERMGAIDTFDAGRFVALVHALRDPGEGTIYAPGFRRDIEEPIEAASPIEPDVRLVVIEGNYLLASEKPWRELRELFDEIWYCERDEEARIASLVDRHREFGKSLEEARRWALGNDQSNADLIVRSRSRADLIAALDGTLTSETAALAIHPDSVGKA